MLQLVLVLVYLSLAVSIHAIVCRKIALGTAFVKFLLIGHLAGWLLLLNGYLLYGVSIQIIYLAIVYAFFCELYIFIFTFVSSSVSVTILLKVASGENSINRLTKSYSGNLMVQNRLNRMQKIGLLIQCDECLVLSNSGQLMLNCFTRIRNFFFVNKSSGSL